jgi:hypothetical protein
VPVLSLIDCITCEISCANTPVRLLWCHISGTRIIICEFTASKLLYSFNDGVVVQRYCVASQLCSFFNDVVVGECYYFDYIYVLLQLCYSG